MLQLIDIELVQSKPLTFVIAILIYVHAKPRTSKGRESAIIKITVRQRCVVKLEVGGLGWGALPFLLRKNSTNAPDQGEGRGVIHKSAPSIPASRLNAIIKNVLKVQSHPIYL